MTNLLAGDCCLMNCSSCRPSIASSDRIEQDQIVLLRCQLHRAQGVESRRRPGSGHRQLEQALAHGLGVLAVRSENEGLVQHVVSVRRAVKDRHPKLGAKIRHA